MSLIRGEQITGSVATASYINPVFISQSAAAYGFGSGGSGGGGGSSFPYVGSAIITGSLLVSGSGIRVIGNQTITGSLIAPAITGSLQGVATNVSGGLNSYIPLWSGSNALTNSVIHQSSSLIQFVSPAVNVNSLSDWGGDIDVLGSYTISTLGFSIVSSTTGSLTVNGDITFGGGFPLPWTWSSITLTDTSSNTVSISDPYYTNISNITFYDQTFDGVNYVIHYSSSISAGVELPNLIYTSVVLPPPSSIFINGNTIITGSLEVSGGITGSLLGTASWAFDAITAINSTNAVNATNAINSTNAVNATNAVDATNAIYAQTASYVTTASYAHKATTASYAQNTTTASLSLNSERPLSVIGSTLFSTTPYSTAFTDDNTTTGSIIMGSNAGNWSRNMSNTIVLGSFAGSYLLGGSGSVYIGQNAGSYASGSHSSVMIGKSVGVASTGSTGAVFIGEFAGSNAAGALYSTFIGRNAGAYTSASRYSTYIGYNVGLYGTGVGSDNNIIVGTNISLPAGTRDSINIGGIIFGTGSYSDITTNPYTGSVGGKVGINVVSPTYTLDVSGSGRFTDNTSLQPFVVTSGSNDLLAVSSSGAVTLGYFTPRLRMLGSIASIEANGFLSIGNLSNNSLMFTTNGVDRWYVAGDGHILSNSDNQYDIGASGLSRPRNLYVAGTGSFKAGLDITGSVLQGGSQIRIGGAPSTISIPGGINVHTVNMQAEGNRLGMSIGENTTSPVGPNLTFYKSRSNTRVTASSYIGQIDFYGAYDSVPTFNKVATIYAKTYDTASWGDYSTTNTPARFVIATVPSGSITLQDRYIIDYDGSTILSGSIAISGSLNTTGSATLIGNSLISGSLTVSGSTTPGSPTASIQIYGDIRQTGYHRFDPVSTNIDTTVSASYIYVSGSTNDLYFSQNGNGYNNVTRLRWLEGNLYTGILNGGLITTQSSTLYQVGSGSGIIVSLNTSLNNNPYPVVQYLSWPNLSASIAPYSASYDQQFIAITSSAGVPVITSQPTPYSDGDFNTKITIGIVIHQNHSTINAVQTFPSVGYGWKQRSNDFIRAFGPLKISGYALSPSGSSTGSLALSGGTAWVDGRNYIVSPSNPSYIVESTGIITSKIYRYRQSGSEWAYDTNNAAGYPTIDPANYSLNGVLTPVPTNNWTIQRVFYFPNSATKAFYIYYGNAAYANKDTAIAAISTETFSEAPNTAANAIFVGYMILRHNADFTVAASYQFNAAGLFRGSGQGGAGGGGTTTPGGSNTQIQYNNNGAFGGVSNLTWDGTALSATGSFSGSLTGSLFGTASWAINAATASLAPSYVLNSATSSFATTGSNAFNGNQTITGSFTVSGSTALIVTGSASISGSVTVTGNATVLGLTANRALTTDANDQLASSAVTATELGYLSGVTSNIQTQISNVRDQSISVYQALGSSVKAQTVGLNILGITQVGISIQGATAGSQIRLIPIYIETPQTITGVMWYQGNAVGVYTASNENRTGLYSYSPSTGIATLQGSGANNSNLWSGSYTAANTYTSQSFTSQVTNAQGFYYIAMLMSFSGATTAPTFGAGPSLPVSTTRAMDFTSGSFIVAGRTTILSLPGTVTVNTYNSAIQTNIWAAVY
jgi:hypothetical protein